MKKLLEKYREIISYLVVGGLTTLVSLGVYYACVLTVLNPRKPIQLQAANVISWIAAVAFAYFANRRFVFRSNDPKKVQEASRFVLARVGTLLMDMGLMFLMVTALGMSDKIAKLIVQVVVTVGNYIFSKFMVFHNVDPPASAVDADVHSGRHSR